MDVNQQRLDDWHSAQERRWEAQCRRCGACCGVAEGDPCEHLRGHRKGEYFCAIYDHRFGEHKTVSGKIFRCVPLRQIIHDPWPGDEACGYKQT